MFRTLANRRFKPIDLALAMLVAGWVPSVLMAFVSYRILNSTLESKVIVDRQTLVKAISHLIGYDIGRTGEVMEHYQTLPLTQQILVNSPEPAAAERWLSSIYYSHPRVDGMFLADAEGRLLAAVPAAPAAVGKRVREGTGLRGAAKVPGYYVSEIHPRQLDKRMITSLVAAVRSRSGETVGFIGAQVLIERLGRRLQTFTLGEQSIAQVIDQDGMALFDEKFSPLVERNQPVEADIRELLRSSESMHFRHNGDFYSFSPIEGTGWTAVLRQPVEVAYRPVRELLKQTAGLAAWLILGTAAAAWFVSHLYRRQLAADERIARETMFNEKVLKHMPVGIALVDPVSKGFVQVNDAFVSLVNKLGSGFGRDSGRMTFSDMKLNLEEPLQSVLVDGGPFQAREMEVVSEKRETFYLTINLIRLQDARLMTHGILFLIEDNTADVAMRQELISANSAKDHFLALLSHELRNPLSPVITMVAELGRQADGNPETQRALDIIRRNVELEARLIDDLLDITRITHNKLQLNPEIVDAHDSLRRAIEICENDLRAKNLQIQANLHATRHHVHMDPARLQQVFWNLIKNSVKFTPAGGITIHSKNEGELLVIHVTDTGIGIEPDRLGRIFKAFDQGDASMTRRFGGLGLGLAISKAMVDAHGGRLSATSAGTNKGATFTVELHTVNARVETDPAPKAPVRRHRSDGRRILLVDDHIDTCTGMKMLLERRGYRVCVGHTVAEGLQRAEQQQFDLLISDLGLPDGTGFELMEKLGARGIPGIALSGYGMESDIERSRTAGFMEHMIKPINIEKLEGLLRTMFTE